VLIQEAEGYLVNLHISENTPNLDVLDILTVKLRDISSGYLKFIDFEPIFNVF
jgi:hypothetical protein